MDKYDLSQFRTVPNRKIKSLRHSRRTLRSSKMRIAVEWEPVFWRRLCLIAVLLKILNSKKKHLKYRNFILYSLKTMANLLLTVVIQAYGDVKWDSNSLKDFMLCVVHWCSFFFFFFQYSKHTLYVVLHFLHFFLIPATK